MNTRTATQHVLEAAFHHTIEDANVELAFEQFQAITNALDYNAFRDAIDACLRDGLIHEPIRLPDGALQCHWRLELTPKGVAAARKLSPSPLEGEGWGEG